MKSFMRDCALFAAFHLLLVGWLLIASRDANGYTAALIDKYQRARETSPPRLLLAGGSSLAWSIQSPILEKQLARPVVNLGLHAGTGLDYRLREAAFFALPGDVILLSIEHHDLFDELSPLVQWRILEACPESARFVSPAGWKEVLDEGLIYWLRDLARKTRTRLLTGTWPKATPPYSRDAFNIQGDCVGHYDLEAP